MSSEQHLQALTKLCRVCGNNLEKSKPSYECSAFKQHLLEIFGICVGTDNPSSHPALFCRACYDVVRGKQKADTYSKVYKPQKKAVDLWCLHESPCAVCEHYTKLSKGGRPRKARSTGRPTSDGYRAAIKRIRHIAPPTLCPDGVKQACIVVAETSSSTELQCPLCLNLLDRPVELLACRKLVCSECLVQRVEASESVICPVCNQKHLDNFSSIQEVSSLVSLVLRELVIRCHLCLAEIKYGEYAEHISNGCKEHTLDVTTVEDILSKPLDCPLLPSEQQLQTQLTKRSLATSSEENILRVKTGGQVHVITCM